MGANLAFPDLFCPGDSNLFEGRVPMEECLSRNAVNYLSFQVSGRKAYLARKKKANYTPPKEVSAR